MQSSNNPHKAIPQHTVNISQFRGVVRHKVKLRSSYLILDVLFCNNVMN